MDGHQPTRPDQGELQESAEASGSSRSLHKGRILLIFVIVAVGLISVAGVVGIAVYNQATKLDRSTPTVVARQFLEAALIDKDVKKVGLFVCQRWPADQAMDETAVDNLDPSVAVDWGATSEEIQGGNAQVVVRITFSQPIGGGNFARSVHTWTLDLEEDDGWRVCAIDRGSSFGP
jgi:hypothetical protein